MKPEDIVLDGNTPEGTRAPRAYLEYARSSKLHRTEAAGHEPKSDFKSSSGLSRSPAGLALFVHDRASLSMYPFFVDNGGRWVAGIWSLYPSTSFILR
jgi:hypothetical protein